MSARGFFSPLAMCFATFACAAGKASAPAPSPDPAAEATETRYREGDFVVYRYAGSFSPAEVTLREEIERRDGNRLHILVTIRKGSEERRFVQVVTDTPENQKAERIDELYRVEGEQRVRLENEENADLYALYGWTLPPEPAGPPTDVSKVETQVQLGGASFTCTEERGRMSIDGAEHAFRFASCPSFLWKNGPAEIGPEDAQTPLWKREVIRFGRERR